jgi:uncharacterized protein YndB with AHSA1/START domain
MSQTLNNPITVQTIIDSPISKVWNYYTQPQHITGWNFASDDWQCPKAKNNLREGGTFSSRMEAKDGSVGFDFGGYYSQVVEHNLICYTMANLGEIGRKAEVKFEMLSDNQTKVTVEFEVEEETSREMQQTGWQSILDNFKKYTESTNAYELTIKANLSKVWNAISTSEGFESYMKNMKVESDWQKGSSVKFTCYNSDGTIMLWDNKQMIWSGIIK